MANNEIIPARVPEDEDHRPPVGAAPGSMVADANASDTHITVIDYGPTHCDQVQIHDLNDLRAYMDKPSVTWVDVTGFKDIERIRSLGEMLGIHPLALADVVNVPQRAKTEVYPDYVFVVTHAPEVNGDRFYSEQVAVLFGEHFVLSFQEHPDEDQFKLLRNRIRASRGLVRHRGAAYLGYCIVDVITDAYFPVLDRIEDRLDALEARILSRELEVLEKLYELRHVAQDLRRAIESHRDALSTLMHVQVSFVPDEVRLFMRDCLDHALSQASAANGLMDYVVSLRELLSSEQAQRMNEVMKVLTMVATIFIPLSFFAGVYGMNFEGEGNMPELHQPGFYWIWWVAMLSITGGMIWYFRKRKWL